MTYFVIFLFYYFRLFASTVCSEALLMLVCRALFTLSVPDALHNLHVVLLMLMLFFFHLFFSLLVMRWPLSFVLGDFLTFARCILINDSDMDFFNRKV